MSLVRARKGQGGDGGEEPAGDAGPGLGDLGGQGEGGGGDEDGHRVGGGAVLAFAAADLDSGRGGGEFGDDGVGPAEPASGSGRGVAHGPVVDVGERGGSGHARDDQQDEDLDGGFGALRAGHGLSPPQRCWAPWRVMPSRRAMSAQE
jgi:hypothetical protein